MRLCVGLVIFILMAAASLSAESFLPQYSEFKLKNGLKIIAVEDHRLPMVYYRMNILSGTACDSTRPGLASMTLELLRENTRDYPDGLISLMVDSVGGILMTNVTRDYCQIDGDFLSRDLESSLNCLGDMVMRAEFRDSDVNRMRRRLVSILAQVESVNFDVLWRELYRRYYGNFGYGLYPYGTAAGLQDITLTDITSFYSENFRPNNAQLVIGGDFETGRLKKLLERVFDSWPTGNDICRPISNVQYPDSLEIFLISRPEVTTSEFMIGRPGVIPGNEDYAKLLVLNYVLGGGGRISRLYRDLVQDAATCTFINSATECSRLGGMFYVHGGAYVESSADALAGIMENMKMLGEIKISVAELQEAKDFFAGSQAQNYASYVNAVGNIAENAACGNRVDSPEQLIRNIENLTPDRLRDFAREFFNPSKLTIVVTGPPEKLKRPLGDIAPVILTSWGTE